MTYRAPCHVKAVNPVLAQLSSEERAELTARVARIGIKKASAFAGVPADAMKLAMDGEKVLYGHAHNLGLWLQKPGTFEVKRRAPRPWVQKESSGRMPGRPPTNGGRLYRAVHEYRVVCISLYESDLQQLDALVSTLKGRGMARACRSALIRAALRHVDLDKVTYEELCEPLPTCTEAAE